MKKTTVILLALTPVLAMRLAAQTTDYKVAPQDKITVDVFQEDKLSHEYQVSASGTINYPLLETIKVAGLTPAQISDKIRDGLKADFLVNPQVNVTIKEYTKRTVSVLGQVTEQATIELPGETPMTIPEAIGRAKGFGRLANKDRIKVTHRDGTFQMFKYDELQKPGAKPYFLQPGDTIDVAESRL